MLEPAAGSLGGQHGGGDSGTPPCDSLPWPAVSCEPDLRTPQGLEGAQG